METNKANHIGIILDGNRRYAKQNSRKPWEGHDSGAETFEKFLEWAKELDLREITAYVLSLENLKRDEQEVKHLFELFKKWFKKFKTDKRVKDEIKIRFIGDLSLVPEDIAEIAKDLENETKNNTKYKLNFCFAYGGRQEIVNAFNKIHKQKKSKDEITEKDIEENLWLSSSPDLVIRTGGAIRTSNFLPWQTIYSEWFFPEKLWPEFTKEDLIKILKEFESRKRNFGK